MWYHENIHIISYIMDILENRKQNNVNMVWYIAIQK